MTAGTKVIRMSCSGSISFHPFVAMQEMRRAVCEELWAEKLLSLGLILHVAPWHDDLLNRLTLIVREERRSHP
eukprot:3315670-Amphidinium_carterae.1